MLPPASSLAKRMAAGSKGAEKPKLALISRISPMAPPSSEIDQPLRLRVEAVHEGFREEDARLLRSGDHGHRIRPVDAERLLAEDVLPRLRRPDPPVDMERVRRGDVDRIDSRVGKECLVGHDTGAGEDIAEAGREGRAASDRLQLSRPRLPQGLREGAGDDAGAEDAPSDRAGSHGPDALLVTEMPAGAGRSDL